MRHLLALSVMAIVSWGGIASAEEASEADRAAEARPERPRFLDLSLLSQADTILSGSSERNYYEYGVSWQLRAEILDRLTADLALGFSSVDIDLFTPEDAPFDARLHIPWRATVGCGMRLVFFRWKYLDLSLFAEVTFPVAGQGVDIESTEFFDSLALLNLVDDETIRSMVGVSHTWYRAEFGLTLRGIIGRWRPFIDIKYVYMPGRLDLELDGSLQPLLGMLDDPLPLSYDASFTSVYYALGFEVELGYGFELGLRVAASPTRHDGWLFVGRLVFEVPLTAQPRRNWPVQPDLYSEHYRRR